LLRIEQRLDGLAETLRQKLRSSSERFVEGFVTATLLYLTGAMTIAGSIQDGVVGDPSVLLIKSLLDGVASVAPASGRDLWRAIPGNGADGFRFSVVWTYPSAHEIS